VGTDRLNGKFHRFNDPQVLAYGYRRPGRNATTIFAIEGIRSFVTLSKTVTSSRHRR
jgi:hypothetical protein